MVNPEIIVNQAPTQVLINLHKPSSNISTCARGLSCKMAYGNMAMLSHKQIAQRRQEAMNYILVAWESMQGAQSYTLQCPCDIECDCMPPIDCPHIVLQKCLYVGELDFFIVNQPFLEYGFEVSWFCNTCEDEMACGMPT